MFQISRGFHCQMLHSAMIKRNVPGRFGAGSIRSREQHVLTVSTTRGTPSTSINLKEALCEKIPVHYDLLRNLRRQYGPVVVDHVTVDNIYDGLMDVHTMVRETTEVDPRYGVINVKDHVKSIKYRGLTIPEIIALLPRQGNSPSPEAVFWLLLTGDVPTQEQTAWLIADWSKRRQKRREWWLGPEGGIVGAVLKTLPNTVSPLGKLSVALNVFDTGKYLQEAVKNGVMSHTYWEYMYEDGMELLATLPAIVALVAKGQELKGVTDEGDWVQFLLECFGNVYDELENYRKSIGDFLRLYITLNADEDGGAPAAHVMQILGTSQLDANYALAAGVLASVDEPKTGTMQQCMEFQAKLQDALGREPNEESLKNYLATVVQRNKLVGYKESGFCDPRYKALLNYAKEYLPDDAELKISQDVTRILMSMMKRVKGKSVCPEQNAMAAPIFQYYGLKDMKFNQVLLCMSRALGAIASIIWTRAINAPTEQPRSKCTYTYLESVQGIREKPKRGGYTKRFSK